MSGASSSALSSPAAPFSRAVGGGGAKRVLPGFSMTLGFAVFYLCLIVLIPLSALVFKTFTLNWDQFWVAVTAPRVLASYRLTFGASLLAALVNLVFGLLVAWVLVRYKFPGKRIVDALAFVVRTVQPVLEDAEKELEEAATSLGATRLQTFTKVIFPSIAPALLTGFAMAFARAIGEYGSVIFIAGNMPMISEITPLIIIGKLEQYDYAGATAVALVMLVISFLLLLVINGLQAWQRRRAGA
jgi:sulfate transport system permease protein